MDTGQTRSDNRRSRMTRTRSGKRLMLTERDIELFRWLRRYRYLRSTYLHAFVGGASATRFKERLGDLFHEGYLDRPARQWEFADARSAPVVYEIGEPARRILTELGAESGERTLLSGGAHRQFLHANMICECLASIELATRCRSDLRFIPWAEIVGKMPSTTAQSATPNKLPVAQDAIIPDGLFGIEYTSDGQKAYRFFALEVDRGTMPISRTRAGQTSYLGKLLLYRQILDGRLYRSHWGIPNLFVLTLTLNEGRAEEILRHALGRFGECPLFLLKAAQQVQLRTASDRLLVEPWRRPGLPALAISG